MKKLLLVFAALLGTVSLVCNAQAAGVITVGASPTPHAEILAEAAKLLKPQGYELKIVEYSDYVQPNVALDSKELDANYFQHKPYLDDFNAQKGTRLGSMGPVHYEPFGIYAGKSKSLKDLKNGALVAVPNDATNEARALQLLAAQGLIELKEDAGLNATPNDITSNPKNLQFKELEAAMLPQTASEVDLSVINSNFAMEGGMNPATDSLASEDADSEAAQTFANIVAVKEGHENDPAILALIDVLHSDTIRDYINNTYSGAVVPTF